ncbi:TetR/AcrR family transcriptional regulator [Pseudomonas cerasi]|nr:TetR/AcrR family transcriptional regulator [Pseudomonas cerasi]
MSSPAQDTPRVPQQARGYERTARILEGCARLIVRNGRAGLTMNLIAKESGTAIGSLYHFFPNKEAVLGALRLRHVQAINDLMQVIRRVSAEDWITISTEEMVQKLTMPLVEYLAQNPDCLVSADNEKEREKNGAPELVDDIFQTYDFALRTRMPDYDEAQRRRHVMATLGLPIGLLQICQDHPDARDDFIKIEIPRVFTSYFNALMRK